MLFISILLLSFSVLSITAWKKFPKHGSSYAEADISITISGNTSLKMASHKGLTDDCSNKLCLMYESLLVSSKSCSVNLI